MFKSKKKGGPTYAEYLFQGKWGWSQILKHSCQRGPATMRANLSSFWSYNIDLYIKSNDIIPECHDLIVNF